MRVDIEDRNFHCETQRNGGSEFHFASNICPLRSSRDSEPAVDWDGFEFTPAADRQLRVFADHGRYHPEPEWCVNIPHPIEATRGQTGAGDAYSPGWFELPLERGENATLVVTAELPDAIDPKLPSTFALESQAATEDSFALALRRAVKAFVVRRGAGKTVIAGYPWFLDWGRDSLICARGLIAAGMTDDVRDLLVTFARFEENGTLPNTIHGANASNRDTTDAPLWFGIACEDLAAAGGKSQHSEFYRTDVGGRTIAGVLRSIAINYLRGTPNGIHMDAASALIWSPSHFTWMDTNYPAGTPRAGYPIEIQALWIRLLKQLHRLGAAPETKPWNELAAQAEASLHELFWIEERGWFADVLLARVEQSAHDATRDNALRSNCLFPISLGLVSGERARRCVENVQRYLVTPGALRSLAPLPATPALAIYGNHGGLLNDPTNPYWGRYEGDEDTRRKPAYHNGTAWAWTFPSFCEALVRAWDSDPAAVNAARAYLRSMAGLMHVACAGHIPEVLDGDAPHTPRGCDAQAWSATEALRVWTIIYPPSA